jgi:hypothetical protein
MRRLSIPEAVSKYWPFRGGLDQTSPSISVSAGVLRQSSNIEVGPNGAYMVTQGYERFDGRAKPSDATYAIITATITGSPVTGNSIAGATSGATAVIIASTSTYLVVTKVVGTFQSGETITGSGATVVATSTNQTNAASTPALNATYRNLAADEYRDDIAAPTGSGSVLGVHKYNGTVYCVRNNAGGTAAVLYKETASGWSSVALGREVAFTSGGTTEIVAGNTITGATSGATAVITKVVTTSGTWGAGTAAGYLYFASQTGTFQAENLDVGASLNLATIAGNSSAITLSPSGRFEFINHNFGGGSGTTKMYGCDGVNRAFEFDGTVFAWIRTGMVADAPTHIAAHKNHLFLSFAGSAQHSGIGTPFIWSPVTGAAEIAVGDDITGFLGAPGSTTGGALAIYSRNSTHVLYGNSSSDWTLVPYNPDAGAIEWTMQWLGQGVCLDDRGVTTLTTSQRFGNFEEADIAAPVRPYVDSLRDSAVASCVVRKKNQWRLFFSAGAALYVTFRNGTPTGLMPISLAHPVACIASLEAADGEEEIFFGSTDGYVYQMDRGTSQDGANISWSGELVYQHFGSPMQLKTFLKAVLEVSGTGYAEFSMAYNVGYGTTELPQGVSTSVTSNLSATQWDAFTWDRFYWDGQTLSPSEADLDGTAENIALAFSGSSDAFDPITFNGAIVQMRNRRNKR